MKCECRECPKNMTLNELGREALLYELDKGIETMKKMQRDKQIQKDKGYFA